MEIQKVNNFLLYDISKRYMHVLLQVNYNLITTFSVVNNDHVHIFGLPECICIAIVMTILKL